MAYPCVLVLWQLWWPPRIPQAPARQLFPVKLCRPSAWHPHRMSSTNVIRDVERSSREKPRHFGPFLPAYFTLPFIQFVERTGIIPTASRGGGIWTPVSALFWGRERCSSILLSFGRLSSSCKCRGSCRCQECQHSVLQLLSFFSLRSCMAIPALKTLARFEVSLDDPRSLAPGPIITDSSTGSCGSACGAALSFQVRG